MSKETQNKWEEDFEIYPAIRDLSKKERFIIKGFCKQVEKESYQRGKEEGRKEFVEEIKEIANHIRSNLLLNEIINIQ